MPILDVAGLRKVVSDRTLFDDVTLTIRRGEKVGLVGRNGAGKSTLGRVLAGLEPSDGGRIARRRDSTVDYLEQEPRFEPARTIREVVLERLTEWNAMRARFDALSEQLGQAGDEAAQARLADEQARVAEAIERLGGWERDHEALAIVSDLGLADPERRVGTLSGGETRRVALARLLVGKPDLAILDEPTNHLDIDTIEWLEDYLAEQFPGAILLISHDRRVLDAVTTRTLELHDGRVDAYDGGYATFLEAKAEREAFAERTERNRQNFLRREVEWLRRQPKARGTKQKARIGRAEAALDIRAPREDRKADLRLAAERQGKTILEAKALLLERDGRTLVAGLDLALRAGDRIGIVGPNGSGKTSLLLALVGQLACLRGEIVTGSNTRIGYLDQARSGLTDGDTVQEAAVGDATELVLGEERISVGNYLERFLFDRPKQRLRVGELSGGERARVCLARLLSGRCNLLLLDEPTNDLDVDTLASLEAMLVDFGGSVLVVSHDRWLLDRVATGILAFEGDGRVEYHVGNYSDYAEVRERGARGRGKAPQASPAGAGAGTATPAVSAPSSSPKSNPGQSKKLSQAEQRELAGMLDAIAAAEEGLAALQGQLADPATYQGDGTAVARIRAELELAESQVARLTARWEELESRAAAAAGR
ncbi:MAG: ABC-F family ATP-binding cassette domain-containing protein [Deltaproteobacteria bacterium]|nr:ABC-F family ATP-binding cassette domain-containing protein [Deltaproteobacteria bacterium]